jgi:hypothetical protein
VVEGTRIDGRKLVVIDVDPRNGGAASLEALESELGPLPGPPMVLSGRGEGSHYYFTAPADSWINFGHALAPGVDVPSFVMTPPSVHPATGMPYESLGGAGGLAKARLAALSDDWLQALSGPRNDRTRRHEWWRQEPVDISTYMQGVATGRRHHETLRIGGYFRARGDPWDVAAAVVREAHPQHSQEGHPFTLEEALETAHSAYRYPSGFSVAAPLQRELLDVRTEVPQPTSYFVKVVNGGSSGILKALTALSLQGHYQRLPPIELGKARGQTVLWFNKTSDTSDTSRGEGTSPPHSGRAA